MRFKVFFSLLIRRRIKVETKEIKFYKTFIDKKKNQIDNVRPISIYMIKTRSTRRYQKSVWTFGNSERMAWEKKKLIIIIMNFVSMRPNVRLRLRRRTKHWFSGYSTYRHYYEISIWFDSSRRIHPLILWNFWTRDGNKRSVRFVAQFKVKSPEPRFRDIKNATLIVFLFCFRAFYDDHSKVIRQTWAETCCHKSFLIISIVSGSFYMFCIIFVIESLRGTRFSRAIPIRQIRVASAESNGSCPTRFRKTIS